MIFGILWGSIRMLKVKNSAKFRKDLKKFQHKQTVISELKVLSSLVNRKPLEEKYRDHPLTGNWANHRECHLKPDVLLIYKTDEKTLFLERIGSHSELFK